MQAFIDRLLADPSEQRDIEQALQKALTEFGAGAAEATEEVIQAAEGGQFIP